MMVNIIAITLIIFTISNIINVIMYGFWIKNQKIDFEKNFKLSQDMFNYNLNNLKLQEKTMMEQNIALLKAIDEGKIKMENRNEN